MGAHCRCDDPDTVVRTVDVVYGPPEPVVSRARHCVDCGGLVEVLPDVPRDEFDG